MAKPALLPTCRINSTGKRETMAKATAPVEATTPKKFQRPDHTTAIFGIERVGINDGGDGIGGVVEAVYKFEAESYQKRSAQKDVRPGRAQLDVPEVAGNTLADEDQASEQHDSEDHGADAAGSTAQFCIDYRRSGSSGHWVPSRNGK